MTDQIESTPFRILAIDGGGIRGVVPAHMIRCISNKLAINPLEKFDLIAGTSTGSIIAAAIACKIDPERIVDLYKQNGGDIFVPKKSLLPKFFKAGVHSLYDKHSLEKTLKNIFGNKKLGEISVPLLLPATDIGNGCVHVFKSNYSKDFNRDQEVLVSEAVLASCCAPTYFNPSIVKDYTLADGGLWANNPSLVATIEAQHRLDKKLNQIRVLSLGTGHSRTFYNTNINRSWGLLTGWKGPEFISFLLSLQAQSTQNYLKLMLSENHLLRLDFESDLPLPLDDISSIGDLISRADKLFTHESQKIKNFLTEQGCYK